MGSEPRWAPDVLKGPWGWDSNPPTPPKRVPYAWLAATTMTTTGNKFYTSIFISDNVTQLLYPIAYESEPLCKGGGLCLCIVILFP